MKRFIFGLILGVSFILGCAQTQISAPEPVQTGAWRWVAFGQSTDLNFATQVLPEKIGVNRVWPDAPGTLEGRIVVESRGGKIAAAHDGIAFYYTVLDPGRENFTLEADVQVEQFGPETDGQPTTQTACGLMVRDVNGAPRKNPMVFGFEELPAASNIVANALFSRTKTEVYATAVVRNGIVKPVGNPDSSITYDGYSSAIPVGKTVHLKLERTDTGFILSCSDPDGSNLVTREKKGIADIVQAIDKTAMSVGFFAARNARMVVTNAKLTTSIAHTQPGVAWQPKPLEQNLEFESSNGSALAEYTLRLRSGYPGTLSVTRDGTPIVSGAVIAAGEFWSTPVTLTNDSTRFEATLIPAAGPDTGPVIKTMLVEKKSFTDPSILVAAVDGRSDAAGTAADPLNLSTALKFLPDGGTVTLRGGRYDEVTLYRMLSGAAGKLKTLKSYDKTPVIIAGLYSQASFWHFERLEFAGSRNVGLRIQGNGNIIERCTAHDNGNTGMQMDPFNRLASLRPSDNLYKNCDVWDNKDQTLKNANGFGAQGGVGKGNVYRGCIAHNNSDDGWDFFNSIQDGPNEPILVENCIAYNGGITTGGETAGGNIGNGFKLGGETQVVAHVVRNCLAFHNMMDGFTCNFNPGPLVVENCTSIDNARCNFIFRSNPYITPSGTLRNNLSYRTDKALPINDFVTGRTVENNVFYIGKNDRVGPADFISLSFPTSFARDENGEIIWGNFARLAETSKLVHALTNGSCPGALAPGK